MSCLNADPRFVAGGDGHGWAPDSPDLWAPDSDGHLTLGRAVDLFLAAKAAEGAPAKTLE
jgi:hypothetical protein